MRGAFVTFKKELLSFCVSPVSYVIAVVFYLWRGFELTGVAWRFDYLRSDQDLFPTATYWLTSTYLMVMLVPGILTMRCFAEERRSGSIELLMTAPVRDGAVVFGKWAAATVFFGLLWLPSVFILHLLEYEPFLNADLPFGPVFAAYLGMFLLSGLLLAFGCLASSLTDNVLLAAVLTIMFCLGLLSLPQEIAVRMGEVAQHFYIRELLDKIDVSRNLGERFFRGLVDTSQIAFYLGGTMFFLFLTTVSLSSRRIA